MYALPRRACIGRIVVTPCSALRVCATGSALALTFFGHDAIALIRVVDPSKNLHEPAAPAMSEKLGRFGLRHDDFSVFRDSRAAKGVPSIPAQLQANSPPRHSRERITALTCTATFCPLGPRYLERGHPTYSFGVWPRFHPQDSVRIRTSGRVGGVNQIGPNERGDDWQFEIAFEPHAQAVPRPGLLIADADAATCHADELELIEASGLEHDDEIELALEVSDADAEAIAHQVQRLIAETFSRRLEPTVARRRSALLIHATQHRRPGTGRGDQRRFDRREYERVVRKRNTPPFRAYVVSLISARRCDGVAYNSLTWTTIRPWARSRHTTQAPPLADPR
jgi:hypothetical protein